MWRVGGGFSEGGVLEGGEIQDLHAGSVLGDDAVAAEAGEGAGEAFAGGCHLPGELSLGSWECECVAVVGGAGFFRELEDTCGGAGADAAEEGHFEEGHHMAEAAAEVADDGVGDLGVCSIEVLEVGAGEEEELRVLDCAGGGGVGVAVEERDLADRLAGSEVVEDDLAACGGRSVDLDAAGRYDEEAAGRAPLAEEDGIFGDVACQRPSGDGADHVLVERGEERDSFEPVDRSFHGILLACTGRGDSPAPGGELGLCGRAAPGIPARPPR